MTHTRSSATIAQPGQAANTAEPQQTDAPANAVQSHATSNLWACIRRPINRIDAAHALLGLSVNALRQLGAAEMFTTPIAGNMLDNGPRILEQPGFPHQHLDLASEVAAGLKTLNAVGDALEAIPTWAYDDETLRQARGAYARSTALAAHSAFHEPAVQARVTERPSKMFADSALGLSTVLSLVDRRTKRQHEVLLTMLSIASESGLRPDLHIDDGVAHCGRIAFRHSRTRGADEASGIRVGTILFDVADYEGEPNAVALERLAERAKGLTPVLLGDASELVQYESAIRTELTKSAHI